MTNLAPEDLSAIIAAHIDPRARSFVLAAIEDAVCNAINAAIAHERHRVLAAIYTDSLRHSEEVQDFAYTAIKRYT